MTITQQQARTEPHKAEDAPTLLEAFKSGKAILIDWPMEPVTPQEALKLMGMMDAEHAKTMGKPAPDREMAICMQRVQHMACDLWASQKEVIRAHFVELAAAQAPVVQAGEYPPLPEGVKARFKCEDCDGTGYTGEMIPGSEFQPPEPVGCTSCRLTGWWAECEAYSADQMHAYLDADRASSGAAQAAPRCVTCDGTGEVHRADGTWVGTCFCAEGKRAATTQAVRMLTDEEKVKAWNHDCNALLSYADAVIRAFCAVNAGKRIPASGEIGGV